MPSEGLSDGVFQVVFRNSVEKTEKNKKRFDVNKTPSALCRAYNTNAV
ncbi:hypothetical protein ACKJPP_03175 [Neisseria polysaccharea]